MFALRCWRFAVGELNKHSAKEFNFGMSRLIFLKNLSRSRCVFCNCATRKIQFFWPVATFLQYFFWAKKVLQKSHIMNAINSHIPFQKKKAKNRIIKYLALFIRVKKGLIKKAISRMFG